MNDLRFLVRNAEIVGLAGRRHGKRTGGIFAGARGMKVYPALKGRSMVGLLVTTTEVEEMKQ